MKIQKVKKNTSMAKEAHTIFKFRPLTQASISENITNQATWLNLLGTEHKKELTSNDGIGGCYGGNDVLNNTWIHEINK